jgi:hypothetical protein
MPLNGEFKPSRNDRTRKQVELYEATNGLAGGTFDDKPVIILTYMGAKSGKIRKTPLMRVERDGTYAVAASYAGAATIPSGTATSSPIRSSNCRMARSSKSCGPAKSSARKKTNGGSGWTPHSLISPNTAPAQPAPAVKSRCSCWSLYDRPLNPRLLDVFNTSVHIAINGQAVPPRKNLDRRSSRRARARIRRRQRSRHS